MLHAVRQAAARAVKRNKWSTSDSENDSIKSDGSNYEMSDIESEISEEHSDSNMSSDFNPFNSGSDSDDDPWSRKKKGKKQKKSPKKRTSTQDKLSLLLSQKTNKGKIGINDKTMLIEYVSSKDKWICSKFQTHCTSNGCHRTCL